MNLTIGVTWVPRPSETLPLTSFTFDRNAHFIIYPDGHRLPWDMSDFEQRLLGNQAGCFRHWHRVLTDLVNNTDSDFVGIIPDDVSFVNGIAEKAIEPLQTDRDGYTALYTPAGMSQRSARLRLGSGWCEIKGGWGKSWGGCYVFRRPIAERLIRHPRTIRHLNEYKRNQQIDAIVPEVMYQLGLRQWMHNPSLCEHVGLTSTIGHKHTSAEHALRW